MLQQKNYAYDMKKNKCVFEAEMHIENYKLIPLFRLRAILLVHGKRPKGRIEFSFAFNFEV